jgi:hypothetical protein
LRPCVRERHPRSIVQNTAILDQLQIDSARVIVNFDYGEWAHMTDCADNVPHLGLTNFICHVLIMSQFRDIR